MAKRFKYTNTLPDVRRNKMSDIITASLGSTAEERLRGNNHNIVVPKSQYISQPVTNEEEEEDFSIIEDDFYNKMSTNGYSGLDYYLDTIKEQPQGIFSIDSKKFMKLFPEFKSKSFFRRNYDYPSISVGCFSKENTNKLLQDINERLKHSAENIGTYDIEKLNDTDIIVILKDKLKEWNKGCTGLKWNEGLKGGTKKRRRSKRTKKRRSNKRKKYTYKK